MATTITWYGHSNFLVATPGCTVAIDPFFTNNATAPIDWKDMPAPDVVLVTHLHGDHEGDAIAICNHFKARLGAVVGAAADLVARGLDQSLIINGIGFNIGGTVSANGVSVTMTEAFHTSDKAVPVGYILTLPGGLTIYHAGDTGIFANMATWGKLYSIDLALLPIGGVFTMDIRQAALAAELLQAKSVIPMHYGTFPVLEADTAAFEKELARTAPQCRCVILKPGEALTLEK